MKKGKKNTEALRLKSRKRSLEELSLIDDFLFEGRRVKRFAGFC